jgi:hypothetical protein
MTWAFDVYYIPPANSPREEMLTQRVKTFGGRFDFREEPMGAGICLTYEFDDERKAEHAATMLRQQGEHVEGPYDYGE